MGAIFKEISKVYNQLIVHMMNAEYGGIKAFESIQHLKDYYEKLDDSKVCNTGILHNLRVSKGIEGKITLSDSTGSIDTKFGSIASIFVYLGKKWAYYRLEDGEQLGIVVGFYNKDKNIFYVEQVHKLRPATKRENYELGLLRA